MTREDDLFDLHLDILQKLLNGELYSKISEEFKDRIESSKYESVARNGLLSFDKSGHLIGAYPVSPMPTDYRVEIENVGTGYSMCAIDALGIAFTFMAKTRIKSMDYTTREPIELEIDPFGPITSREVYVTYIRSDNPTCDPAVDQCPSLNFYLSPNHIENPETYIIMNLKEAIEHAITVFGEAGIKELIRSSIAEDRSFALSDRLVDVFEK